jgi:hypothetical protein
LSAFQTCRDGCPALYEAAPCSQGMTGDRAPKRESSSWIRVWLFTPVPALYQSNNPLPSKHRECDILREWTLAHRATRRLRQVKHIIFSRETQNNSKVVLMNEISFTHQRDNAPPRHTGAKLVAHKYCTPVSTNHCDSLQDYHGPMRQVHQLRIRGGLLA